MSDGPTPETPQQHELRELVKGALWIAAIETVPIEHRAEKVDAWLAAVDYHDLWRVVRDA